VATSSLHCRACGEPGLDPVLSLGAIPLVNALVEPDAKEPEPRYPLETVRCSRCTLVQLTETVPPETLFRNYTYFSSYSDTFLLHARRFATESIRSLGLGRGSLVVEAASNDGYLLQYFAAAGVPTLGVEPATNVASVARERGIETVAAFLNEDLARRIVEERGVADLVVANNVLAHVPDLGGFLGGLRTLAGDRGLIVIEVPYLCDLVDRLEFDTIYHEHVSYFTMTSLVRLAELHELTVVGVERIPVHGGSLRVRIAADGRPEAGVEKLLESERTWGVFDAGRFERFAVAVASLRVEVHEFVSELASSGARVAAYGAAAKGVVLANVCGLDNGLVQFVVDRNVYKQGKLLPGVRIPVAAPAALEHEQPDYCLIFAWNLTDEIVAQQAPYRRRGGRFLVPLPKPRVLEG